MTQLERRSQPQPADARPAKPTDSRVGRYAACYLSFLVVLAACGINFFIWEQFVRQLVVLLLRGYAAVTTIYVASIVIVGLILLAVAVLSERALRAAVPVSRLRETFGQIVKRLAIAAFVALWLVTLVSLIFSP